MMDITELLFSADLPLLEKALCENPSLSNQQISLPGNSATAHPLHRICDGVFFNTYSEETALEMARLFITYGADVNAEMTAGKDSPLTAACSLRCDQLALLYIERGADIHHPGCHGGTPLHWASWCGRDAVVRKLIAMNAQVNLLCSDFRSTPLFWAFHGYKSGGKENRYNQVECARLLLEHGADPEIPNHEGFRPIDLLGDEDRQLATLLND